jgi:predicted ATP-grasp superfamily ATP-dependent carboligase
VRQIQTDQTPVFIHEFFSSGAFEGDLSKSSLAREGLAMLSALVDDFSRAGDRPVVSTLDGRLHDSPAAARVAERARVTWVNSASDERRLFHELAGAPAATLVIAPETGGILLERRRMTDAAGGRFLGPSPHAIRLCGDKLRLYEHFERHGLSTLPTSRWDFSANRTAYPFPIVVKPRDGAGSVNTFLVQDARELQARREELIARFNQAGQEPIVQPFVEGRSLSTAALIDGDRIEVLPIGQQRISRGGCLHYEGGRIPACDIPPALADEAAELVERACRSLPGLAGFIGVDLIAAAQEPRIRIVEVNPRLTTSYVGYRRLTRENLAARILLTEVGCDKLAKRAPAHHVLATENDVPTVAASGRMATALSGPVLLNMPTQSGGHATHDTRLEKAIAWVEFDADGEVRTG